MSESNQSNDPVMKLFNKNLERMKNETVTDEIVSEMKAEFLGLKSAGYDIDLSDLERCEKDLNADPAPQRNTEEV